MNNKISKTFLIQEYIKKGKTIIEIADILKCSIGKVYYYLSKYDINIRKYHLDKSKKKMSESHKGKKRKFSEKHKQNLSKALKNREIKWNKKISESHKGKKLSKKHREKVSKILKDSVKKGLNVTKNVKHHIYLKENSDKTIIITRKLHRQLHSRAYDYIYEKYGEKGINDLLKWFFKKFGGLSE